MSLFLRRIPRGRFIFIILDTMFNTLTGFRRGKEIAVNLVKEGAPGDNFVVLENNPIGGLKYIGGTARDGDQLIKKIKKLVAPPDKWTPDMYSSRLLNNNITSSPMTDPRLESSNWKTLRELKVNSKKEKLLTLRVALPKVMQNRKVDMFSIRVDPKTQKTVVDMVGSNVKDVVNLKIKPRKGKDQYFVIIEPTTPHCIYNKI